MCTIAPVNYTPFTGYYVIDENYLPENAVKGTISGYLTLNPCSPSAFTAVLGKPLITNITATNIPPHLPPILLATGIDSGGKSG